MMKNRTKVIWGAALLPLVMVAAVWTRLPAQVPIHWNLDGSIQYSGRMLLWGLAGLGPVLALLTKLTPKIDPRKENYHKFEGSYFTFRLAVVLLLDAVMLVTLTESLRPGTVNVPMLVQLLIAALLMVVGNMMPKFRQTFFCGIKNAWTLSSERVWARTHRLGGRLYFAAGAVMVFGAFLPPRTGFVLMMAAVLTAAIVPMAMSYVWFRQEQGGQEKGVL